MVVNEHVKEIMSEINITGVPECVRTKHRSVRIIWIMMLTFGLALTAYFMCITVNDYLESPTVTKVYMEINKDVYPFPPTYISVQPKTAWRNTSFSNEAKFVINSWNNNQPSLPDMKIANKSELGRKQLRDYSKNLNLKTVTDLYMAMDKEFYDEFSVFCERCNNSDDLMLNRILVNNYVTYEIRFAAYSKYDELKNLQSSEYGLGLFNPNPNEQNVLLRLGKQYQLLSPNDGFVLKNAEGYELMVTAQQIKRYNNRNSCTTNLSHSYQACASECNYRTLETCGNCTYVRTGDERLVVVEGDTSDWNFCSKLKFDFTKCLHKFDDIIRQCYADCLPLCDEMIYQYSVLRDARSDGTTWVAFTLSYPQTGLMIFEEKQSITFQAAISNVGGQLGLWLGMSLITVVQVIMIVFNRLLNQCRTTVVSKPISVEP